MGLFSFTQEENAPAAQMLPPQFLLTTAPIRTNGN
jgi:hypothetical protein